MTDTPVKFDMTSILSSLRIMSDEEIDKLEAEKNTIDITKRLEDSGIPERYLLETFDTFEGEEKTKVQKYITDKDAGFLVLYGKVGTGKTHLACACIRNRPGLYVDVPTLEIEVECSRDFSAPENKMKVLEKYARSSFLVIDEIGRASNQSAEKAILYFILNKRYNARKPTVLVTNFSPAELAQYLGTAIIDRIAENRVLVEFDKESYRRKKGDV